MKKTVAILGRPNVGKSTLFNRIIRKREAIVDDQPGVTRDRKYASAEWAGIEFTLVDTGGFIPNSDDLFETAIRQQVRYAIHEAAVVIFLTDVVSGITPLDTEIASLLLKSGVPVILTVNKVDNAERREDISQFYRLGLGDPYPVSAISGREVGDFLDAVVALLPTKTSSFTEPIERMQLAILGRPNVGKSSLVNAILGQEKLIVTEMPGTTRDSIDTLFRYQKEEIVLIDTAGLRKRARVKENIEYFSTVRTAHVLRRCDVAVVLIDATQSFADQDKKVIAELIENRKGIVIGVNKWDLMDKETNTAREMELEMKHSFRELAYIPILFISAKTKQRVFRLLDVTLSVFNERKRKIKTSELNKFLQDALAKNHPPAYGTKYVKINYVAQTRVAPPVFTFFCNEPRGIKNEYKNYLENQFRMRFGFLGVPIGFRFRKKN